MGYTPGNRNTKLAVLVIGALAVMAQQTARAEDTDASSKLEKVEVTGSSIKRTIDSETALPVQIITHEDIVRSGVQSTEDLLRTVTAASGFGGIQTANGSGATTSGVSTVSLRGLGASRTLVLINGRRSTTYGGVPGGGGDTAVDVNGIPLAAIERVEILKEGASAVYGSDAVAGVINFILKSNYNHGEVTASYGDTLDGGASLSKINGAVGFGDLLTDKYNVMISGNYQKEGALYGRDRNFANSALHGGDVTVNNNFLSSNTFPANVVGPDGSRTNPGVPNNCAPSIHVGSQSLCRFDTAPYVALVPESERSNLLTSGHLQINDDTQLYGDLGFAHQKTTYTIQPSPLSDLFSVPKTNPYVGYVQGIESQYPGILSNNSYGTGFSSFALPGSAFAGSAAVLVLPTSPYYQTALNALSPANRAAILATNSPIDVRYRSFAAGLRSIQDVNDAVRFVGGFKGLAFGWDYDTALLYNQSKVKESTLSGYIQYSKFMPLVDTGVINPFGPTDAAGLSQAASATYNGEVFNSTTTLTELSAKASRDIYEIPGGGPVSLAVGASLRKDKYEFQSSTQAQQGDISGYGGNYLPVSKSRNVEAAFTEIVAQLTQSVEVDGAVRYENYEGTGNTVTPKVSARWQPSRQLLFRSSWGKGFRAPSLTDLYAPNTQGVSASISDPLSCGSGAIHPNPANCQTQFQTQNGGNPGLQPEKSENFTLGTVWQPTKDIMLDLDYYHINLSNSIAIGGLGASTVLGTAQLAQQYANLITRNANGTIVSINQLNANLYNIRTAGFDLGAHWNFLNNDTGRWTLGFDGTYVIKYGIQQTDGTYQDAVGSGYVGYTLNGNTGIVARFRGVTSLNWDVNSFATSLRYNYQDGYADASSTAAGGDPTLIHSVGEYQTWDLQTSYTGFKDWTLAIGARNLFNTPPPYSNIGGGAVFQAGYDPSYGDPRGRFTYASITYKFK